MIILSLTCHAFGFLEYPQLHMHLVIGAGQQQRHAHESPALFYACVLGGVGPVFLAVAHPLSRTLGYKPAQPVPDSYPRESYQDARSIRKVLTPLET